MLGRSTSHVHELTLFICAVHLTSTPCTGDRKRKRVSAVKAMEQNKRLVREEEYDDEEHVEERDDVMWGNKARPSGMGDDTESEDEEGADDNDDEEYVAGVTTGATGGTPATGNTAATGDPAASAAVPPLAAPQAKARHVALEFFYRSRTLRALNRAKYYLAREQHSFTHSGCINISDHF